MMCWVIAAANVSVMVFMTCLVCMSLCFYICCSSFFCCFLFLLGNQRFYKHTVSGSPIDRSDELMMERRAVDEGRDEDVLG